MTTVHFCAYLILIYWSSHVHFCCPIRSLVLFSAYSALRARKRPSGEQTAHSMVSCLPFSLQVWTELCLFRQLWKQEQSGKFLQFTQEKVKRKANIIHFCFCSFSLCVLRINCYNSLHAHSPFGGYKMSGIGREL